MFGRVAAGLVHDLLASDSERRQQHTPAAARRRRLGNAPGLFGRIIDRELTTLKRFLDDLRNVVKPKPIERFAMDVNTIGDRDRRVDAAGRRTQRRRGRGAYAPGPLVIDGDRFALGRVYRNLITNAIQATAPGGSVTIATARAGDHVEISVTDTGSGIRADRLSAIFDDFVTTKRRGLGLGLAISKRIVEQLDGTIAVESEVGRGTAFTLTVPRARRAAGAGGCKLGYFGKV